MAAHNGTSSDHPTYKDATVHAIFQTAYKAKSQKPSISTPALNMASEVIRLFTLEAIHRSASSAKSDPASRALGDNAKMDVSHLHKNAAALTLDFGG